MATALQERLDPVASLLPRTTPDETAPPGLHAIDNVVVDMHPAAPEPVARPGVSARSGFSALAILAATVAHILIGAGLYFLVLRQVPELHPDLGDAFDVMLAEDRAGYADGKADRAPDGAPRPDAAADPQAHARLTPSDQPQPAPAPSPPTPIQPPSFSAMPMPTVPAVPDTADAWAPRVQAAPAPPPPPVAAPPAPPKPPAATSHVVPRPSMQRSVDLRAVPGHAPHRELSAGSDSGVDGSGYGSLVFRAIDRVRFYPPRSQERGDEGVVLLRVVIGEGGRLIDAFIARGSGVPDLDAATIEMAYRASYPPLPSGVVPPVTFNVPVHFGIRYRR